jgi:predicted helicase
MGIDIAAFVSELQRLTGTGQTTEHSFRPALATLLDSLADDVHCINEPTAIVNVGRPDFVLERANGQKAAITVGHVEAKDIDLDIRPKAMRDANKAQFERYVKALPNLIYTNGLDFAFYKNGELVREISIGDWLMGVQPKPENYEALANQLRDFAAERLQTITSAERLAEMMAGKAVLAKDVLFKTLREDKELNSELAGQFKAFKDQLIHDLEPEEFADIYAETIAYGMFAARLHDETLDDFTREEALRLLPKTNPFLRKLFEYVAGTSLSEPVRRTIDELAEIFQATDLQKLFENFGAFTQRNDPFIHFYETFLAKYNPAKRKARGVWYTPEPVVNFIVRAVDDVLKTEFGLSDGLADTSKITIDWDTGQTATKKGKAVPIIEKKQVHRVQILDPAAGTGTFLAEVIRQIGERVQGIAPGQWSSYVENEMIPRLHGFELLMASYAMCHMKLDMMLTKMGYKPTGKTPPRLGVYLTNSLEEGEKVNQTLPFAQWLSNEARQANTVKNDVPVMCVIGNPPYSIMSGNLREEQVALVQPYRSVDGVRIKEKGMLQFEKNINNDYIKFLSLGEKLIHKNGFGILAYITSHGYLKSSSFRGLRSHLLETFHRVLVIDLHGNSEIREVAPNNIPDKNVFDIKQGVAIIIGIRRDSAHKKKGTISFTEMWGTRSSKYDRLSISSLGDLDWVDCEAKNPSYIFHPSGPEFDNYGETFPSLASLMPIYSSGVITARDNFSIDESESTLIRRAKKFAESSAKTNAEFCAELGISEKKGWDIAKSRQRLSAIPSYQQIIKEISYRPFDDRKIIFDESVVWTTARSTMDHMLRGENICLVTARSEKSGTCSHFYLSNKLVETKCGERTTQSAVFPLYLYPAETELDQSRRVNMDPAIRSRIEEAAMGINLPLEGRSATGAPSGLAFGKPKDRLGATEPGGGKGGKIPPPGSAAASGLASPTSPQGGGGETSDITPSYDADGRPNEVAIFDYIYGVLHCPAYRETYREFLKIDFPRVPYPASPEVFRDVQEKGTELRRLHLMEDAAVGETPYPFTGEGDPVVGKVAYENGAVFINDTQCFENVPAVAWEFYIGGYQPAQKWLKDR